jgi:hypothetical protein
MANTQCYVWRHVQERDEWGRRWEKKSQIDNKMLIVFPSARHIAKPMLPAGIFFKVVIVSFSIVRLLTQIKFFREIVLV